MKKIRITESTLRGIVRESVKKVISETRKPRRVTLKERKLNMAVKSALRKVLKEGGHLYWKDEDGNTHTNSKQTYRGVPGSIYIWHGEWADPEVLWDGVELNANDVEESLWYSYKDECKEMGENPTENGFESWLEEMGTEYIASTLDDCAWAANGCP